MPKKKLTKAQVAKLQKQISLAVRKLTIDKMDYGTESHVRSSIPKLLDQQKLSVGLLKIIRK
jgi:hypothetical protein